MSQQIQAVRGMNDILPEQIPTWRYLKQKIQNIADIYGYREIQTPLMEVTELFSRGVGTGTDIIEKEMYNLLDRNGQNLALRPEATASIVRAGVEKGLLYNQVQRLWTLGPMFRYERPQKGRYRQFYQASFEAFGVPGAEIDAEIILLSAMLLQHLNLTEHTNLNLNNLGSQEDRLKYKEALVAYFSSYENDLDEDSKRRLIINPLRILDSKNPKMRELINAAPILSDYLSRSSQVHFDNLLNILDELHICYKLNNKLVRGLDYYNLTVFEWITDYLGAQGTLCAGGRYDGLVETLGGKETAAVGCAMGLERLVLMLDKTQNIADKLSAYADISMLADGADSMQLIKQSELLRKKLPTTKVQVNYNGSLKSKVKRAEHTKAAFIWILASDNKEATNIKIKCMSTKKTTTYSNINTAINWLIEQIGE